MSKPEAKTIFEPEVPVVPADWEVLPFKNATKVVSDKGKRVKQRDYQESGKIPVIDQGQDFIGGYTDEEDKALYEDLPVILFGDHTRSVKYVDKPFAVGAEGVKILKPAECYDPKFFYFLLRSLQIPSRGYSRHFQFLKKFHLPVAPENEQKRIVAKIEKQFSRLDEAVENLKRVKANLKRYKASVLKAAVEGNLTEEWRAAHPDVEPAEKLLERILAERRKKWEEAELAKMRAKGKVPKDDKWKKKYKEPSQADISTLNELPNGWHWTITDQLFWFVTSGSRGWAKYYSDSGAVFFRIGNLDHNSVSLDLNKIQCVKPPKGAEGTRTKVEENDILISITADVGMIGVVPRSFEEAYINQHISLARPVSSVNSLYIAWYLTSRLGQNQFVALQRGATKAGLGLDDIRSVNIPIPPFEEQAEVISQIEKRLSVVHEIEIEVDKNLKRTVRLRQSILKKAFSGKLVS